MTPEEQADAIVSGMHLSLMCASSWLRPRIVEEIRAALAEAKVEERREWEEKLRLVHGVEW